MPKSNVAGITQRIYDLLESLPEDDRHKAMRAVSVLLGAGNGADNDARDKGAGEPGRAAIDTKPPSAAKFFHDKAPNSKHEQLAVAARFREIHDKAETHTKDDLKAVFDQARANFDGHNFRRDIANAKVANLFVKGSDRGSFQLSYYGQNYVDTLPNRDALANLARPKGGPRRKTSKATGKG